MSSILRMLSNRSAAIAQSFGARAASYEENADLQRTVAKRLACLLPQLAAPRVLELGCGTGLFSRHLLARYPDGAFVFTDLHRMVNTAGERYGFGKRLLECERPPSRRALRPDRHEHDAALARRCSSLARHAP